MDPYAPPTPSPTPSTTPLTEEEEEEVLVPPQPKPTHLPATLIKPEPPAHAVRPTATPLPPSGGAAPDPGARSVLVKLTEVQIQDNLPAQRSVEAIPAFKSSPYRDQVCRTPPSRRHQCVVKDCEGTKANHQPVCSYHLDFQAVFGVRLQLDSGPQQVLLHLCSASRHFGFLHEFDRARNGRLRKMCRACTKRRRLPDPRSSPVKRGRPSSINSESEEPPAQVSRVAGAIKVERNSYDTPVAATPDGDDDGDRDESEEDDGNDSASGISASHSSMLGDGECSLSACPELEELFARQTREGILLHATQKRSHQAKAKVQDLKCKRERLQSMLADVEKRLHTAEVDLTEVETHRAQSKTRYEELVTQIAHRLSDKSDSDSV